MTQKHTTRRGHIQYQINDEAFPDGIWGGEDWIVTRHADGSRTLRSHCVLNDQDGLIRDVILSVDDAFHPHDVFVRLTKDGKFYGSTWYLFTDETAEYQGYTVERGRISDTVNISRDIRGFGTHALMSDAWLAARFDYSQGPSDQTFRDNLLTSTDHRGATGPDFQPIEISTLRFHGIETVNVQAGTFECYHMSFAATLKDHPFYEFWVTTDGDFIYVKSTVAAPYNWSFELTELHDA